MYGNLIYSKEETWRWNIQLHDREEGKAGTNLMHLCIHGVSTQHWVVQGRVPQPFHVHLADSPV